MKTISAILILLAVTACQSSTPDSLQGKKSLLEEKQTKLASLQEEIRELQSEIAELDTTEAPETATPVKTTEVRPQPFDHFVELTGTVDSRENILISAEAGGRVESVPVTEGEKVRKGQVLVRIDNEDVKNQLSEARASYELAETTFRKRENLWEQNIGSEIEYLQAKNNYETARSRLSQIRSRYENTIIKSPIEGTVDNIEVNEGEFVNIGSPVVRVVDVERVEIEADISERYLSSIKEGDSVRVKIPGVDYQVKAVVDFVSQVINPENRSFTVKVKLPNEEGLIKPNALANLMIRDYHKNDAIVVPSSSIGKDLQGDFVYLAESQNGQQVARKQHVERGKSFGAETEILEGLSKGDRIITAGAAEVNEGEPIAVQ